MSSLDESDPYLSGKLIVAMPGMQDPRFAKSVIYMCAHSSDGAMGLVFNRVRGNEDLLGDAARDMGLDVFGMIPFDENIATHDLIGKPLTELPADSPAFVAYCEIVEKRVLR